MKKRVAILTLLGVGAAALAVLGRKMSKNEEKEAEEQSTDTPLIEPCENTAETAKTDTVMPLFACFYTEKGTVWHADRDCFYIRTAAEIFSDHLEGAHLAGKNKPCSHCAKLHNAE